MKKIAFYLIGGLMVVACSPKTTETVTEPATDTTMPKADIAEGKVVYLKDCAKCHAVKPVHNYTQEQWMKILPAMIKKARLDEDKSRQVTAYVDWELTQK